jgi:hypothetical protein
VGAMQGAGLRRRSQKSRKASPTRRESFSATSRTGWRFGFSSETGPWVSVIGGASTQARSLSSSMTKHEILAEIRRTAQANGAVPLGRQRFRTETGIKKTDWYGKHWASWGEAVQEAGLTVNEWTAAFPEEHLLIQYAAFVRELGRPSARA